MRTKLAALSQVDYHQYTDSVDQSLISTKLRNAILWTLAYADVFDYPLTAEQLHRYLIGMKVPSHYLRTITSSGYLAASQISESSGFYTLAGRESIVKTRKQRAKYSAHLWPKAIYYGNLIARLPFVRMVAVTGALAMNNIRPGDDIDYLIVTVPGRLWLCRAIVIALVRRAAQRGDTICPNYFLSERAKIFTQRTLYTAHELVQMAPLSGRGVYEQIRKLNTWAKVFLPNAGGPPSNGAIIDREPGFKFAEAAPLSPVASWLEQWEMKRKVRKFQGLVREGAEVSFCADWCKGHFDGHGDKSLKAFTARLKELGISGTPPYQE